MARIVTTGEQSFQTLRRNNYFYIDKTKFIKDWWLGGDPVTLITRPRRFGKTLMLDTVNTFFSYEFAGRSDLFAGLEIWKDEQFRNLQGTLPVIFLSFGKIKNDTYEATVSRIKTTLASIYGLFTPFIDFNAIPAAEKNIFTSINDSMSDEQAQDSLHYLCKFLTIQHKVKPIILLDEYDAPLQEAWLNKYWDKLVSFMRSFFNATFKDNPWLGRGLITGITRVAKESIFSDLNNLKVITTTTNRYTDCFGFTEQEVFVAMDEYGLTEKEKVKEWYDGFIFGKQKNIYNPWSIIGYLSEKEFAAYWAHTSSNGLVGKLLAHGDERLKKDVENLLDGKSIITNIDDQIVFSNLDYDNEAIWSLLLASGYVKAISFNAMSDVYEITLTNLESKIIMEKQILNWFKKVNNSRKNFQEALLADNLKYMNKFMSDISKNIFSFFDTSGNEPERFYHAFVLGIIVDLKNRYEIRSNRESGFGRYDVTMFPEQSNDHGIVIEFKTLENDTEKNLQDTCKNALKQIKEKKYISELVSRGIGTSNIYVYGFSFKGKEVLICGGLERNLDWSSILDTK